jgi:two-component system, OmpR family, phosphate regulon sensor histidine kinase PhoR
LKKSIRTAVVFMVLAILLLIAFQSWWLWKTYRDERREVYMRVNPMFRESIWQLQTEKLRMDSTVNVRVNAVRQLSAIISILRSSIERDAPKNMGDKFVRSTPDTTLIDYIQKPGNGRRMMYAMLLGVDSLQDSLTIREITARYQGMLRKENIPLAFEVKRVKTLPPRENEPLRYDRNETTIGFLQPITYRLEIGDTTVYVLKRLRPQILFSIFLIALTVSSFWLLIKNLLRQQRLTELKNDFINNVTHELKTPIATVSVAIEALKNFNAMQDVQRTRDYLDISANELSRLNMLVDRVLKLSMFERKALEMKAESLALDAVVQEVVRSMQLQFEKHGAVVDTQLQGTHFSINGDRMHITSVVYNLLDNALKYSKEAPRIQIQLKETDNEVLLVVADNGIGISPAYRNRVFDKFFRVPHGDRHDIKGYGLGLSYVAQVVQDHKGHIEVSSEEGQGSTFTVYFPKGRPTLRPVGREALAANP